MSAGDRRPEVDGLADLPIRRTDGAAETGDAPGLEPKARPRGAPANLELFEDPAPASEVGATDSRSDLVDPSPPLRPVVRDETPRPTDAAESGDEQHSIPPAIGDLEAGAALDEDLVEDRTAEAEGPPVAVDHLFSAVADSLVHLGVLSVGVVGMALLDLRPALDQWPGFAVFLLLFSLLYFTLPLVFWGHTPGMAWRRLRARDPHDRPLTLGQTALRFLAAWLTPCLLGLPLLLAWSRATLADRLSGSVTQYRIGGTMPDG